jgi:hypothetical protein
LNIIDDFKTNLLWLSTFIVRSAEGMSMRMPVNCRPVLQSNCFKAEEGKETKNMLEAVHEPDGDTFQNSPLKLVFTNVLCVSGSVLRGMSTIAIGMEWTNDDDALFTKRIAGVGVRMEKEEFHKSKMCIWEEKDEAPKDALAQHESMRKMAKKKDDTLKDALAQKGCKGSGSVQDQMRALCSVVEVHA